MHDTPNIPLSAFVSDGQLLTKWLGSFWNQVFKQPQLAQNLQQGHALNMAQVYLDFLENLALLDRRAAPVFHRQRWTPIVLHKSQRHTGNANLLRTDMDPAPVIGPQPPDSVYAPGETFEIGGHAEYLATTSYPLDDDVIDLMTCVTDNIMAPNRVLVRGVDYFVRDNTIFFLRDGDPFDTTDFPVRVYGGDEEVLLWASNTLVDRDFIYEHMGYVLGVRRINSSLFYKQMLNGLWDIYNMGTPLAWFTSGVGAMLGEPTILSSGEVVEVILDETDRKLVVTDKEVYTLHVDATLRDKVIPGAIMEAGELLTDTIRIYDTLDPKKLAACSEYGERLRTDAFSLFFGKGYLRAPVKLGVGASWEVENIVQDGTDGNGDPRLRFKLYGLDSDVELFWSEFWAYAEAQGLSSEACFEGYLDDTVVSVDGTVHGRVSPLEYLMRYFLRANAMVILIERDKLSAPDTERDTLEALHYLKGVVPAHIALFIIEQRNLGPDVYDLTDVVHNVEPTYMVPLSEEISHGGPSATAMTYTVRPPLMRWIPTCKE